MAVYGSDDMIHTYQLALHIRRRVLKVAFILFCKDIDVLYNIAYRTVQPNKISPK